MSKTIHIHIHRAPAKDAWEESKHKRAANGQFGSGGGGAAPKPAAKSASSAAKKSFEQQVKETRSQQLAAEARKSLGIKEPGAKPAPAAGPKSFEQRVKETRMKQLAAAGAKSLGVPPPKADNPENVKRQLAARQQQLKDLNAEIKAGKHSPEDVKIMKEKAASLGRMISNYEAKLSDPRPVTANERKEPNQVRSDVIATINKRLDGPLTAQSKKELLEKKARLIAAQKAETASKGA